MTRSSSWSRNRDEQPYHQLVGKKEHVISDNIGTHGPWGMPLSDALHRFASNCTKKRNTVLDPLRREEGGRRKDDGRAGPVGERGSSRKRSSHSGSGRPVGAQQPSRALCTGKSQLPQHTSPRALLTCRCTELRSWSAPPTPLYPQCRLLPTSSRWYNSTLDPATSTGAAPFGVERRQGDK